MKDLNIIKIPDVGQPTADVLNNFINKIANAIGWVVTPRNLKANITSANKSIIEEISKREDINPIERAAIINNYKKIVRDYTRQADILQMAIKDLKSIDNSQDVSDDWLEIYFEKVKHVSNESMKIIWAKILAGEFNQPNTYGKQLLHVLSIMNQKAADCFLALRSSCFYLPPNIHLFIYRSNGDITFNNSARYNELGITFSALKELDNLGLIKYRYPNFYNIKNGNKAIHYGKHLISLQTDDKYLKTGNVSLTDVGKQLCKIIPMKYDDKILETCFEAWEKLGYQISIEIIDDER